MTGFWSGRRVFLTGHTGFKGSWLSLWLARLGATVRGFALPPGTEPALFAVAHLADTIESELGDVRDLDALRRSLVAFAPDTVLHLAAQPLVRASYDDPVGTYQTNVIGTVHLLEAVRACPAVRAVVIVTTDKCYENREWPWAYRENEAMGGHDPYSSSKGAAELVTASYRRSFFAGFDAPAVASARAGNVIGGGDWAPDRLVPDILRAFASRETPLIRNPHAVRPWQHVLEPLSGYLMLARALHERGQAAAEAWNFGPRDEDAARVDQVASRLAELWGEGASWRPAAGAHPHEAQTLRLDIAKARAGLGWHPRWSLDTALRHTVAWERARLAGADMRAACHAELDAYEAAAD